jgi:hypothetical protein
LNIFIIDFVLHLASVDTMHDIEVEYVTFPGWRGRSTSECRTFNSLPHNARLYVQFIEQFLGVPGLCFYLRIRFRVFVLFYSEMDWRRERSYGNDPCLLNLIDRYNEQDQNKQILSN